MAGPSSARSAFRLCVTRTNAKLARADTQWPCRWDSSRQSNPSRQFRHPLSARGNVAAPGDGHRTFFSNNLFRPAVPVGGESTLARDVQCTARAFNRISAGTNRGRVLAIPITPPPGQEGRGFTQFLFHVL